ncbi:unnamed protein product [Oppiella nova]|uniref:ZIP family metal transporter n=1 Tax=Oppiella nova TaxID=334625 RepID=A0A7R9QAD8_9ACAR|nr:unnamed protein product [Oppiella nova]CAG2161871.1 unnamed protein product [Oppiella nova]
MQIRFSGFGDTSKDDLNFLDAYAKIAHSGVRVEGATLWSSLDLSQQQHCSTCTAHDARGHDFLLLSSSTLRMGCKPDKRLRQAHRARGTVSLFVLLCCWNARVYGQTQDEAVNSLPAKVNLRGAGSLTLEPALKADARNTLSREDADPSRGETAGGAVLQSTEAFSAEASSIVNPAKAPPLRPHVAPVTVAFLTILMALATGLGSVPFFFLDMKGRGYGGICNGMACGVMLAASFGLLHEGESYGGAECVVLGVLLGGLFILGSQKYMAQFGEVKLMSLEGVNAHKAVLIVAIMTLHAFGEGAGVGVSFAGPRGLPQGLLVTIAIAVHNIPEGLAVSMVLSSKGVSAKRAMLWSIITSLPQPLVAVPAYMFAETFTKFLPLCMGFAAGCMIWMVFAELLPDGLEETSPTAIAASATISIAFMEALSAGMRNMEQGSAVHGRSPSTPLLWSLLFGVGPAFGGLLVVLAQRVMRFSQAFMMGGAAGLMLALGAVRPFQLLWGSGLPSVTVAIFFGMGAVMFGVVGHWVVGRAAHKKTDEDLEVLKSDGKTLDTPVSKAAMLGVTAILLHAWVEGLVLGVAALLAEGNIGLHMLAPVVLHSLPRGAAIAAIVSALSKSYRGALLSAALSGFAGPAGAVTALVMGLRHFQSLDGMIVLSSGGLVLAAWKYLLPRAWRLDTRRTLMGLLIGAVFGVMSFFGTHVLCLYTFLCVAAPDAVT